MIAEKPGLAEQLAVAVNASTLTIEVGRETPLEKVAAMGLAGMAMREQAAHAPALIAADLAPLLWRAKHGKDVAAQRRSEGLFADWMCVSWEYFAEIARADPGLLLRFSRRVLEEWISHRCGSCGGGGKQQLWKNGRRTVPVGMDDEGPLRREAPNPL